MILLYKNLENENQSVMLKYRSVVAWGWSDRHRGGQAWETFGNNECVQYLAYYHGFADHRKTDVKTYQIIHLNPV